ncbi:hypothetical protein Tsubulata_005504 [Turnera subulata]|uniref:DUF7953 domain-containing protein n=1 Tax=Turnera subulata TaxID=218843 RepID=A0A9Q0FGU1_9ROSI|nr:hypothetical protein Tsubulata_005504 [Turnera subulata]
MPFRESRVPSPSFICSSFVLFLGLFPVCMLSAVVTLDSIEIYKTHEWLKSKPTVYFHCKGENETELPDVKEVNVSYVFKGEESWQPLTELTSKKCKRCGFYEKDTIKADDVFDEWEICASDFADGDGKYRRTKVKEFDATFLCTQCLHLVAGPNAAATGTHSSKDKELHLAVVIFISVLVSIVLLLGIFAAYKHWQKRKRQQDQARFLKLFEDGDELEDELGLGP